MIMSDSDQKIQKSPDHVSDFSPCSHNTSEEGNAKSSPKRMEFPVNRINLLAKPDNDLENYEGMPANVDCTSSSKNTVTDRNSKESSRDYERLNSRESNVIADSMENDQFELDGGMSRVEDFLDAATDKMDEHKRKVEEGLQQVMSSISVKTGIRDMVRRSSKVGGVTAGGRSRTNSKDEDMLPFQSAPAVHTFMEDLSTCCTHASKGPTHTVSTACTTMMEASSPSTRKSATDSRPSSGEGLRNRMKKDDSDVDLEVARKSSSASSSSALGSATRFGDVPVGTTRTPMGSKSKIAPDAPKLPPAPSPTEGLFPTEKTSGCYYLLWLAIGASATLQSFGFSTLVCQGVGAILVLRWISLNMAGSTLVWESFLFLIPDIFFREFASKGAHKIPDGAAILCIAPHSNQFLDPFVVGRAVRNKIKDPIGYVIAAVTLRRRIVGDLAKLLDPVPVERPQDIADAYPDLVRITTDGKRLIRIEGETDFRNLPKGATVIFKDMPNLTIDEPVSEYELTFKSPAPGITHEIDKKGFKVSPHVDNNLFLSACVERLQQNRVVGIFPEGGSHDRTKLLELKPGIALLALHATAEMKKPIPVVPVGLNYFRGHQFRSRVFVDIEDAVYPTPEIMEKFQNPDTKRDAVKEFLKKLRSNLLNVVTETQDFETLKLYWALRRLYTPKQVTLNYEQKQKMTRAFADGYEKFKDHPDIIKCIEKVKEYTGKLQDFGIHDYMVQKSFLKHSAEASEYEDNFSEFHDAQEHKQKVALRMSLIWTLMHRMALVIVFGMISIPASVLALPVFIITMYMSNLKAKEALKKSTVKIAARDVMGSWKVLTAVIVCPIIHCLYTWIAYVLYGEPYAFAYFFFMPFVSYFNLYIGENMMKVAKSLKPLIFVIFRPKEVEQLRDLRNECVHLTCKAVDDVGWGFRMQFRARDGSALSSPGSVKNSSPL